MEFIYFTLPNGNYLVMDLLGERGSFTKEFYSPPTLFSTDTTVEDIYPLLMSSSKVNIKAIQTKTFKM